jgi:hypothetical protein
MCDHILAEQTEHNIKASTAESKVKSLLWLSKYPNDDKPFEQMTKHDILSYLNSLRKPTSIDLSKSGLVHTTTGSATMQNSLGGFTIGKNLIQERESAHHVFKDCGSFQDRKSHYTNQAICGIIDSMQSF